MIVLALYLAAVQPVVMPPMYIEGQVEEPAPLPELGNVPLDKTVIWDISKLKRGDVIQNDAGMYCVDPETFRGMAQEKQRLVQERDNAVEKSHLTEALVGLGLGLLAGGTAVFFLRK